MIKLHKVSRPEILDVNGPTWTAEFIAWLAMPSPRPPSPRRWAHPGIKSKLLEETHAKCAYCESRVTHVYPGDSEHIEPKVHVPARVVDWENLTFACWQCNHRKDDYYDPAAPLVHPYDDEPEDHIRFYGPQAVAAPGSAKGLRTLHKLELGRVELFDRRRDVIDQLVGLLELWVHEPEGLAKDIRRRAIESMAEPPAEYASTVRWFLRSTPEWDCDA